MALLESEDAGFGMESADELDGAAGVIGGEGVAKQGEADTALPEAGCGVGQGGCDADVEPGQQD